MTNIGVLVMDDDPDTLEFVKYAIERTGHRNYKLFMSDAALLENMTDDIHVYILDHSIPGGLSGLQVLKLIKIKNKSSFVIAYTGYSSDPQMIIDYMNAGCQKWVKKGGKIDHLSDCIKEGLEAAKQQIDFVTLMRHELENPLHHVRTTA